MHRELDPRHPNARFPRAAAAPAPPVQAPRRLRAADQGPLDWLVPFLPPVLRVNRETRAEFRRQLENALSLETLVAAAQRGAAGLRTHWRFIVRYTVLIALWLRALLWVERNEHEFTTAFVIVSGFAVLVYHLFAPAAGPGDGLSAYSVFNRGGRRMLGSLSAEQFENEIRHRAPRQADEGSGDSDRNEELDGENDDEHDPELLLAMQMSLKEKKRVERRMRRTSRRR